jgi:hypothetical protein
MEKPYQKSWLWKPAGEVDLRDEELDGRTREEMWTNLRIYEGLPQGVHSRTSHVSGGFRASVAK